MCELKKRKEIERVGEGDGGGEDRGAGVEASE